MTERFVFPFQRALNNSGAAISGARLNFYLTGTTTRKDTFSDRALSTANANPVMADSSGRFGNIFLLPINYKVVLTDSSGTQIWTAMSGDPVYFGSEDIARKSTFLDDFIGTISTPISSTAGSGTGNAAATISAGDGGRVTLTSASDDGAHSANCSTITLDTLDWSADADGLVMETKLSIDDVSEAVIFVGFTDTISSTVELPIYKTSGADTIDSDATNACGVGYDVDGTTDEWFQGGVKADTDTAATHSGSAPTDGTLVKIRVEVSADGAVEGFIDDVSIGTAVDAAVTVTTALTPAIVIGNRSANQVIATIDYIYAQQDRVIMAEPATTFPSMSSGPTFTSEIFHSGSRAINYPPTINAGDLIISLFANEEEKTSTYDAETPVNPWTSIFNDVYTGNQLRTHVAAKIALGSEGGTTFGVTLSGGSDSSQAHTMAFTDWSGDLNDLVVSGHEQRDNSSPSQLTLPALTLTSASWYFLGLASSRGGFSTSTPPSDFTSNQASNGSGTVSTGVCGRESLVESSYTPADTWQFAQGGRNSHLVSVGIKGSVSA